MSYNGFYTRQEQEDVMAARIDNPNRVGSGFINFGAMERTSQPAANWQTASMVGAPPVVAPSLVSDIWASSTPAPPPTQVPQQRFPTQPTPQMAVQPQLSVQPFAAPPGQQRDVASIFQSLQLDAAPPPQHVAPPKPSFMGATGAASACAYGGLGGNMSAGAVQQPFMNGGLQPLQPPQPPPPAPQQQQTQTLMNLLQAQAPVSAPVYGLGNGTLPQAGSCATRMQAAFSSAAPPAPQCQLPPNGCTHASAFASAAFAPSASRQPVVRVAAPPTVPKSLSSAADYAAAAQSYKAPPSNRPTSSMGHTASVARKPEASTKASQPAPVIAEEEWSCPRCTFSNNSLVFECEMCGFERPGKAAEMQSVTPHSSGPDDDGWKPAGSSSARKTAPVPTAVAATGKSKAQSKNEKRRAKKRGEP